jgi:hypothetical protein
LRRGYPAGDTFEETARPEGASLHRRKPRVDRRCDPRHLIMTVSISWFPRGHRPAHIK